jgi:hypothetical protein
VKDFWSKIRREIVFALWVALAGAVAGVGYALWAGLGVTGALPWALGGALAASVILTAIKMALD